MTLREITYSIIEILRGDLKTNDYIDERVIQYFVHTQRAMWIARELAKPNPNLEPFIQDLGCVKIEKADAAGLCALTTHCNVMQTVNDIPKPLFKKGIPLITRVGPINKYTIAFDFMSVGRAVTFGSGKFNANRIASFYDSKKIKLKSANPYLGGIEYINIVGIFENPSDVRSCVDSNGLPMWSADKPYPISAELLDYIHGSILEHKFQLMVDTPSDRLSDETISLQTNQNKGPETAISGK